MGAYLLSSSKKPSYRLDFNENLIEHLVNYNDNLGKSKSSSSENGTNLSSGSGDKRPDDDDENIYYKLGKKQLLKAQRSFQNLIKNHDHKLNEYKNDPLKADNKNLLCDATKKHHSDIVEGRIISLLKQITKQKQELVKINQALGAL